MTGGVLVPEHQVLDTAATTMGLTEFALIERLQLSSRSDAGASTSGAFTNVEQFAYPVDGQIIAEIQINPAGRASLKTEVKINDGQTGVLAQARSNLNWHASHRFCARCGAESQSQRGGLMRLSALAANRDPADF